MPPSSSGSFIPKRNPSNKPFQGSHRNFFVMSMISYALFVAAPLASIAVFIYDRHTVTQFNRAVAELDTQISTFNEADFVRVADFDNRLQLANKLIASHVSIVSLLSILESTTAETVQFNNIEITRVDENAVSVEALLRTSELDGALFQRASYNAKDGIAKSEFSEVAFIAPESDSTAVVTGSKYIGLKANLTFNTSDILYRPLTALAAPVSVEPVIEVLRGTSSEPVASTSETSL